MNKKAIFDAFESAVVKLREDLGIDVPDPQPPQPHPQPQPPQPARRVRHCAGLYLFDPGEENRSYSADDLRLPAFAGGTIRFRRPWVVQANGLPNWDFLDRYIEIHHKVGKPYTLLCMSGDHPRPWEDDNIQDYLRLIDLCSERYGNDELLAGWHVTGCTPQGVSEELHYENGKFYPYIAEACVVLTSHAMSRFRYCDILQAISGKDKSGQLERVVAFGAGMDSDRYLIKNNNAKAIEIDAFHNRRVVEWVAKYGIRYGSEPAGSYYYEATRMGAGTVNDMINQSRTMATLAGEDPDDAYIAVYWPDRHSVNPSTIK